MVDARAKLDMAADKYRTAALKVTTSTPTAADFDVVREREGALQSALDAGKSLEPKDADYGAHAASIRAAFKTLAAKVDARWKQAEKRLLRESLVALNEDIAKIVSAATGSNARPEDFDAGMAVAKKFSAAHAKAMRAAGKDKEFKTLAAAKVAAEKWCSEKRRKLERG